MAGTQINVEAVRQTAGSIANETATIEQAAKKLQAGIESISSFWKGSAASKYAAASQDIHKNLGAVVQSAHEIKDSVHKTAAAYAAADQG